MTEDNPWGDEDPMQWVIFLAINAGVAVLLAEPQGVIRLYNIAAFGICALCGIYGAYKATQNNE